MSVKATIFIGSVREEPVKERRRNKQGHEGSVFKSYYHGECGKHCHLLLNA